MNVGVSVKNQMIGVFIKMITCEILAHVIVNVQRHVQLTNIYILKIVRAKNVFRILVLACDDEILNTTKTSLNNKKGTQKKFASFTQFYK